MELKEQIGQFILLHERQDCNCGASECYPQLASQILSLKVSNYTLSEIVEFVGKIQPSQKLARVGIASEQVFETLERK